jgi:retron-type reverse transcriptase
LEKKHYCSGVFLDVAQAFDRVWHPGLLYKLRFLPTLYNRHFRVSCDNAFSEYHIISAGVPQGSILAPTLYNIYTSDIPHNINTTFGTFADDTGIIASDTNPETASFLLQTHLNQFQG